MGPIHPNAHVNYSDAIAFLDTHINMETGMVHDATRAPDISAGRNFDPPSLDRMRRLVTFLGDPQMDLDVLHITGTNGKGSTARMAESLLRAHGLSTGLYTSPHLHRANERIVSNGADISDLEFAEMVRVLRIAEDAAGQRNSWFELLTAGALRWFSDLAVEAAVVEVGAGGRWDATNVADGAVAVITNIDLDHQQWFGPTKLDIAREKVGIIKPGSSVVLGEGDPDILNYLVRSAQSVEVASIWTAGVDFACDSNRVALGGRLCSLRTPTTAYRDVFVPCRGAHQGDNAAVALAAVEAFVQSPLDENTVRAGFENVLNPGRMEVVGRDPLIVLDGAHNVAGAQRAAATLLDEFAANPQRILIVGLLNGKDPGEMLDALNARASLLLIAPPPSPRAMDPELIIAAARSRGIAFRAFSTVELAVDAAIGEAEEDSVILVCGSLYTVAAARAFLRN